MSAIHRSHAPRRRGMKVLAALLSTVCAVELLIAFDRIPMAGWPAPSMQAPALAGVRDAAAETSGDLRARLRGLVWPRPVLTADEADIALRGAFTRPTEAGAPEIITFDGSLTSLGATIWRTAPLRIASGEEPFAVGQTFARRLRAARDAQIELRRIVPNDAADETEVASTPLCAGDRPGVLALLHRPDQVDVMLFRRGADPGPGSDLAGLCGVWTFAR